MVRFLLTVFILNTISFAISFDSQATEEPSWAQFQSGWTVDKLFSDKAVLKYKSGTSMLLVSWRPVEFSDEKGAEYIRSKFKLIALESRTDLFQDISIVPPEVSYSVPEKFGYKTALISSHTSLNSRDLAVFERLWVKDNFLWQIVLIDSKPGQVDFDFLEKTNDALQKEIIQKKYVYYEKLRLPQLYQIFMLPTKAFAYNEGVGSVSRPGSPSAEVYSQECLNSGYAKEYLRKGPPVFDIPLSEVSKKCLDDIAKIKNALTESVLHAGDLPQTPVYLECQKQFTTEKPTIAAIHRASCNRQIDQSRKLDKLRTKEFWDDAYLKTQRYLQDNVETAFQRTTKLAATALLLYISPRDQIRATNLGINYLRDKTTGIKCLRSDIQQKATCEIAAQAAVVIGALVCTAATKGRCLLTIKNKLAELTEDVLAKFKSPGAVTEEAAAIRIAQAEKEAAAAAEDLETRGLARVREVDCRKINEIYPGAFPDSPRGCSAIHAEKDISGEFCGCGKLGKARFNFLFYCPKTVSGYQSTKGFSDKFTLPIGSDLDMCSRVKIPAGKECYTGSTARVFDSTLAGNGGGVQIFCLNGLSPSQIKKGINEQNLSEAGLKNAKPELHVTSERWSPFTEFPEYQKIVQEASVVCKTSCDIQSAKTLRALFKDSTTALEKKFAKSPERLARLEREKKIFDEYIQELLSGERRALPNLRLDP